MVTRVPVQAVPKPRLTQRDRWAKRPVVLRYRDYCDELRNIMGDYDLPGHLDITFHLPMPKSWSKKKRALMDGTPHEGKPDIDNLAKGFMDAFKKEDKHVYKLTAAKYWADTAAIDIREG